MVKKILRIICYILAVSVFLFGALVYFYPVISRSITSENTQENLEIFREMRVVKTGESQPQNENKESTPAQPQGSSQQNESGKPDEQYTDLYNDMKSYNERIFTEGQKNLKDAWSYEQSGFYLGDYGLYDGIAAELRIPAMNCDIPLYLGATLNNMAYGAAQLGETSMPIGGKNTNCVIAAHRGASTGDFFLYIENLKMGDKVYIDNLWETLTYKVARIEIISPDDIDRILIEKDKDMITLITCHPYPYNYQRYAVFCERDESGSSAGVADNTEAESESTTESAEETLTTSITKENEKKSSQGFIVFERALYIIVPVLLIILTVILFLPPLIKRKKNNGK